MTGLASMTGGEYQSSTALNTFNGGLTISGGTFTGSSGNVDVNGVFTLSSGTLTAPSGTLFASTTFTISGAPTFTHNSGTVELDSAAATITTNGETFNNVTFSNTSGSKTLVGSFPIAGNLVKANNGSVIASPTVTISLSGNYTVTGAVGITDPDIIVKFTGTAAQTISLVPANAPKIEVDKASNSLTLASNVTTANTFTVIAGTLDLSTFTLNANALFDVQGGTL